jgi:hypothetical protein
MMRPVDSTVRIGVVTIEVCGECAKPVEDGLDLFKRSMDFIETLKRFL